MEYNANEALDQIAWTHFFSRFSNRMQTLYQVYLQKNWAHDTAQVWAPAFDLLQTVLKQASFDFQQVSENYQAYTQAVSDLLSSIALGKAPETYDKPDRRFNSDLWKNHPLYRWLHQHYLLICQQIEQQITQIQGLDRETERKLRFYIKQFLDAISPGHFFITNPDLLQITFQTQGENIIQGLDRFIEDIDRSDGKLQISMTDLTAFKVGENIATTPGKVIYQNDLMQLIQYTPQTTQVYQKPLLIIPPWINKYYILDINPKQSMVNWLVQQGYTVFIISWINPNASYANKDFEDYLLEGPIAALTAIEQATGEQEVNAVGYCIGGTLLGCTLSYLTHHQQQNRITSATYLTTLLDFSDPGDLGVFIDEKQLQALETIMEKQGFLDGQTMAHLFGSLRANDLIWTYYVKHYLEGKAPMPMDILFWNADSTHLPAAMHRFYLRNMYLHNRLVEPGGIELAGTPIHLNAIKTPVYFLSAEQDHIAPWQSTYLGRHFHGGPTTFVLAGSGHVMGVINSPGKNKYYYYTEKRKVKHPDIFIKNAKRNEGSWWNHWEKWMRRHSGNSVAARIPGKGQLPALEAAPGTYAKGCR